MTGGRSWREPSRSFPPPLGHPLCKLYLWALPRPVLVGRQEGRRKRCRPPAGIGFACVMISRAFAA